MKSIAIFGRFCAGKTTLATELAESYGYVPVSMAENMKWLVRQVYGTTDKASTVFVTAPDGGLDTLSVRQVLQGVGQNMKLIDRDFWLKWFLGDCESIPDEYQLVMDDARMTFEAEELRKRGWLIVRLNASSDVRNKRHFDLYGRYPSSLEANHPTETEVDSIMPDVDLDGTRPVEDLADILAAL